MKHHGVTVAQLMPRRPGPESELMSSLVQWVERLGDRSAQPVWAAESLRIGAGIPDIIVATYRPELGEIKDSYRSYPNVLGYLRHVSMAQPATIAARTGMALPRVEESVTALLDAKALHCKGRSVALTPAWRDVLPKTFAIEAKVSNWRTALRQACRNRLFVHESYVALPTSVASRASRDPVVMEGAIGVLAIGEGGKVKMVQRPKRRNPVAWGYYYRLALAINDHQRRARDESTDSVCSGDIAGGGDMDVQARQ